MAGVGEETSRKHAPGYPGACRGDVAAAVVSNDGHGWWFTAGLDGRLDLEVEPSRLPTLHTQYDLAESTSGEPWRGLEWIVYTGKW